MARQALPLLRVALFPKKRNHIMLQIIQSVFLAELVGCPKLFGGVKLTQHPKPALNKVAFMKKLHGENDAINSFGRKEVFFSSLFLAPKHSSPYFLCQKVSALSLPHSSPSPAIHAQALKDSKRQADLHQKIKRDKVAMGIRRQKLLLNPT